MSELIYLYRFIPIILFLHPFLLAKKRKNKIALVICGLYLASSVGSLFVSSKYLVWHDFQSDTFCGFLFYGIFNLPLLYVSLYLKPIKDIHTIKFDFFTKHFVIFLVIGALYSVIYQLPYALDALSQSAHIVRTMDESILPNSILTTFAVGFSAFFNIYLFYFFVGLINKWNKFITFSMLLGALSFVVNVLTVSGRDGFVLFTLSFLLSYFLFEHSMNDNLKKRVKVLSVLTGVIFIIIFSTITLERFSRSQETDLVAVFQIGGLNYFSMQPFTFNDVLKYQDIFSYGRGSFPLFYSWFFDYEKSVRDVSMAYKYNFAGYVGTFYKNGGYVALALIVAIFYVIFYQLKNLHRKYYISQFSIFSLYFFFMTSGLFYFRLGNKGGNLFILLSILLFLFFKRKIVL